MALSPSSKSTTFLRHVGKTESDDPGTFPTHRRLSLPLRTNERWKPDGVLLNLVRATAHMYFRRRRREKRPSRRKRMTVVCEAQWGKQDSRFK